MKVVQFFDAHTNDHVEVTDDTLAALLAAAPSLNNAAIIRCEACDHNFDRAIGTTYHVLSDFNEVRNFLADRMNPEKRAAEFED